MRYTLMHRDIEVADLGIDKDGITEIVSVFTSEHMPVGTTMEGEGDRDALNEWWKGRSIPASRKCLESLLYALGIDEPTELLTKSFSLSLSDQYWIRPAGENIAWKDINFFQNPFSEDIGDLLFGEQPRAGELDLSSPDNTSEGNLQKKWKIVDGERCLLKSGSKPFFQEPFNEAIASDVLESLGIPHVPYRLIRSDGDVLSSCRDFIDADTEFISAYRAMKTRKQRNDESMYGFLVSICSEHGLDAVPFLDRMLSFDYLIANTDRHLNNFGIIRDATTLEWIGFAPIFDNGGSLWFDYGTEDVGTIARLTCKPFKKDFEKQLGMVTSFDWLDSDRLDDIPSIVRTIMTEENGWRYGSRTDAIVSALGPRIDRIRRLA